MEQFNQIVTSALEHSGLTRLADAAWFSQSNLFHSDQLNRQLKRLWND